MHSESNTKVGDPLARLELMALGASLRLSTDVPGLCNVLRCELGSIVRDGFVGEPDLQLEMDDREAGPRSRPIESAFGIVYRAWLDRVDRYAVLHGAALVKHGRALLLAGPTGSGKTTLSLALMTRGFALLSDDFTPLALESRQIAPFPKALGVRRGEASRLATRSGAPAEADAPRTAVDPSALRGVELARAETSLAAIVLMNGGPEPPQPRDPYPFYATSAGDGRLLHAELMGLPEAIVRQRAPGRIEVSIDPAFVTSERLESTLRAHEDELLEYGTAAACPPGQRDRPQLAALSPSVALVLLLREVQNRRGGGALMQRFGNDLTRFSRELARAIAGLPLAWLAAAEPDLTAAKLDEWFVATTPR